MKAMDELNWSVFGGHHFSIHHFIIQRHHAEIQVGDCLLYTSDAADE